MPNLNSDVALKYADMRRALMLAKHTHAPQQTIDRTIADLKRYLKRPMRVVVLGEHNSGKTALINALLGQEMLPTAVVATTPVSVTMRFGKTTQIETQSTSGTWNQVNRNQPFKGFNAKNLRAVEVRAPNPLLKKFEIIDTPPTQDPKSNIVGADFVIWCTNASQAWSQSERSIWMSMPQRVRKNGVLAVTHSDSLGAFKDREKVLNRLHDEAGDLFEDIKLVASTPYTDPGLHDVHDANGTKALLQSLEIMAQEQRNRRNQAATRIADRLSRVIATPTLPTPTPAILDQPMMAS